MLRLKEDSVNKELLIDNMLEETVVSQRIVDREHARGDRCEPKRRHSKTVTSQNDDKSERRQTRMATVKTTTRWNDDKPQQRQTKTAAINSWLRLTFETIIRRNKWQANATTINFQILLTVMLPWGKHSLREESKKAAAKQVVDKPQLVDDSNG